MQTFIEPFRETLPDLWYLITHGGFIPLLYLIGVMAFNIYIDYKNIKFASSVKWLIFHIKVEKQNVQSTLAVEHIFFQLHASQSNFTWAQKYLEGQFQLHLSLEIVSMGGKISYLVRAPDYLKSLVETSFYAYYPNAEISIVEDYMKNLSIWDEDDSSWDLWGTEYTFTKHWAYPIRTYRSFEHPVAEQKIIDPLAGLIEALGKAEVHELMAVQYNIRPKAETEWHNVSKSIVAELKGEKAASKPGILRRILNFFTGKALQAEEVPKAPLMQRLTEGEKEIMSGVETKMQKTGWEIKIRNIYIAPKDRFDKTKKSSIIGAFRQMSSMTSNNLKPDTSKTWTDHKYRLFKKLEKPYIDWMIGYKKRFFLKAYIERSMFKGVSPMLMNNEEIATLFHFPLATITGGAQPVESIEVKKGQPPTNLPIMG